MKDRSGYKLCPDDLVIFITNLGSYAGLRYGVVTKVEKDKVSIRAVNDKYGKAELLSKDTITTKGDRILAVDAYRVPEKVLKLLDGFMDANV